MSWEGGEFIYRPDRPLLAVSCPPLTVSFGFIAVKTRRSLQRKVRCRRQGHRSASGAAVQWVGGSVGDACEAPSKGIAVTGHVLRQAGPAGNLIQVAGG